MKDKLVPYAVSYTHLDVYKRQPLNEPIYPHGPFVMNTREEIIQAFDDFNKGKFGYLE